MNVNLQPNMLDLYIFLSLILRSKTKKKIIAKQDILRSEKFRCLGLIIQQEYEIGKDVNHRVKARWVKWRSASEVLYNRCIH